MVVWALLTGIFFMHGAASPAACCQGGIPVIVEDPAEPAPYDHDWTVVLDDWIDGTGYTPDQVLASLRTGMGGMSGMSSSPAASPSAGMGSAGRSGSGPMLSGATSRLLGGGAGDVACDFDADNPGQWMTHCHNLYHAPESGMMAVLGYQA